MDRNGKPKFATAEQEIRIQALLVKAEQYPGHVEIQVRLARILDMIGGNIPPSLQARIDLETYNKALEQVAQTKLQADNLELYQLNLQNLLNKSLASQKEAERALEQATLSQSLADSLFINSARSHAENTFK